MQGKPKNKRHGTRPPRIKVPNNERALFTVEDEKVVGVIQRLSLTGGSAILSKGPIPVGTPSQMDLNTVFGRVRARIEFLQCGADGTPWAQAFRLVSMDPVSERRYADAAKQMESAGFSDAEAEKKPLDLVSKGLGQLLSRIRGLSTGVSR